MKFKHAIVAAMMLGTVASIPAQAAKAKYEPTKVTVYDYRTSGWIKVSEGTATYTKGGRQTAASRTYYDTYTNEQNVELNLVNYYTNSTYNYSSKKKLVSGETIGTDVYYSDNYTKSETSNYSKTVDTFNSKQKNVKSDYYSIYKDWDETTQQYVDKDRLYSTVTRVFNKSGKVKTITDTDYDYDTKYNETTGKYDEIVSVDRVTNTKNSYKKGKLKKSTSTYTTTSTRYNENDVEYTATITYKTVTTYKYNKKGQTTQVKSVTTVVDNDANKSRNSSQTITRTEKFSGFNKYGDPTKSTATRTYVYKYAEFDQDPYGSSDVYKYSYKYDKKRKVMKQMTVYSNGVKDTKYVFGGFKKAKTVADSLKVDAY